MSGVAILVLVIIIVLLGKIPSEETNMIEGGMPDALSQFNQQSSQPQPVEYDPSLSPYNFVSTGQVAPNQAVRLDLQADDTVYRQTAGWKKHAIQEEDVPVAPPSITSGEAGTTAYQDDQFVDWPSEEEYEAGTAIVGEGPSREQLLSGQGGVRPLKDLTDTSTLLDDANVTTHWFTDLNESSPNINVRTDNYYDPGLEPSSVQNTTPTDWLHASTAATSSTPSTWGV